MTAMPTVVILAGGLGTRLGSAAAETPKGMVLVNGRPFLEYVLDLLASNGARRVVICRGHLGEAIEAGLGDGRRFGLSIAYSDEGPVPIGTAGALRKALPLLGERFLVMYGDTYLRVDYSAVGEAHARSGLSGLMTVLRNDDRWGPSNVLVAHGRVLYDKANPPVGASWIDYGLLALTADALDGSESDLAAVLSRLSADGRVGAYEVADRFYEIGTPEALGETEDFLRGLTSQRPVERHR